MFITVEAMPRIFLRFRMFSDCMAEYEAYAASADAVIVPLTR